ncbi:MAG: hypothetical protein ACYDHB_14480 [Candidatus Dormibacteria bacterium]
MRGGAESQSVWWRPGERRALEWASSLARATSGRWCWWVAAAVLVLGGAAAGLHLPSSGAAFLQIANGRLIEAKGLGAHSAFMAAPSAALDLRSWLLDLLLAHLYSIGGAAALELAGGLLGAGLGGVLFLVIRRSGASQPAAAMVAGGLALGALDPVLGSPSAEMLALLAGLLLLCLQRLRRAEAWAPFALLALLAVWANLQSAAVVVAPLLVVVLIVARFERGQAEAAPPRWLLPAVLVAVCVNPRGPWLYQGLPLGLGMAGEHPFLPLWSSPDFHPWGARLSELAGLLLLLGYLIAGRRLRRHDASLGLLAAVMSLLWTFYLPLFLVVAAAQGSEYLGGWLGSLPPVTAPTRRRWVAALALLPLLLTVALLARSGLASQRSGGPQAQLAGSLPVGAAAWLSNQTEAGSWYTTSAFGDYLAASFPQGHHLVCSSDPVATGSRRLAACQQLAVLNQGSLGVLAGLGARLAVLPPAAPEVAFLRAEGWRVRYRDQGAVVLSSR